MIKKYQSNEEEVLTSLVQESATAFMTSKSLSFVDIKDFFSDKMSLVNLIRNGLPYRLFMTLSSWIPLNEIQWADLLGVSTKSMQRYRKEDKRFKSIHSEKIIEMTEVTVAGLDVFGSVEKFKLWLETPSYALGNYKPLELIGDSYGKELVLTELVRIDHGIFV